MTSSVNFVDTYSRVFLDSVSNTEFRYAVSGIGTEVHVNIYSTSKDRLAKQYYLQCVEELIALKGLTIGSSNV